MTAWKLIFASLTHHWRVNLAVAAGVAAGAAVLSGALFVGDSVRGSLQDLALDRLGAIDQVLVSPHFFREDLAGELQQVEGFDETFASAQSAIVLNATLLNPANDQVAGDVELFGISSRFWTLGSGGGPGSGAQTDAPANDNGIVLNEQTAAALGVKVGDEILVKIPLPSRVNADSNFGEKDTVLATRRPTVSSIIPTQGLGRFGLHANQQLPKNAFLPLSAAQEMLERDGKANAIFIAGREGADPTDPATRVAVAAVLEKLRPTLEDYGLTLEKSDRGYIQLTSDALTIPPAIAQAAQRGWIRETTQPTFTYLANELRVERDGATASVPYSTVTALDFVAQPPLGPWPRTLGEPTGQTLADDEIALNQWTFDKLNRQLTAAEKTPLAIGDSITMTWYKPEYEAGKAVEDSRAFKLAAVIALDETSAANDAHLTPEVPGVTDQDSINNWDPPFEFHRERIRPEDEAYWDEYNTTPKAFFSLATGQRLWSSRFGNVTSVRVAPGNNTTTHALAGQLRNELDPRGQGFVFQPVKQAALAASAGTTPFAGLFLGLSFVLIGAAALLVLLLFKLGVETRASQVGLLLALGFRRLKVRGILAGEGLLVAMLGSAVGTAVGVGYAWLMIYGLTTWWLGAIKTPFLELHVTTMSVVIGFASGMGVAMIAIWMGTRQLKKLSERRLLAGAIAEETPATKSRISLAAAFAGVMIVAAIGLAWYATQLVGEAQTGTFLGSGFCVLLGAIALLRAQLRAGATGTFTNAGGAALAVLALRNAARNPGRSTLTISLVATALFLITSVSAFWQDLSRQAAEINGGFDLVAQSAVPLNYAFDNAAVLSEQYGFQDDEAARLAKTSILSLPMLPGEDASCNNLYQTVRPRVLAVPVDQLRDRKFLWAGSEAATVDEAADPWQLLKKQLPVGEDGAPVVPVVLDANTAMYSLKLGVGGELPITDDFNHTVRLHVVGLLKNSIFQGDVLMARDAFKTQFPYVSGSRFFLIDSGSDAAGATEVARALSGGLKDYGLATQTTADRLEGFLAVQNTYISTFLTLGGLGLLLGTFGVATVQIRNVFERRAELAVLRATGFRRGRLARLVLLENLFLLLAGLIIGAVCGLVSIFPQIFLGAAAIPWGLLGGTFAAVVIVGLLAANMAAFSTLRAPLLGALRGE